MKYTQYFLYTRQRKDRKEIKIEWIEDSIHKWIESSIHKPIKEEKQSDGRIRRWAKIPEANGKYLRVVLYV
jgi:hypothetical protein